ncbi:hypothetical protein [Deminuibacter soli]|nr:hypothetical protein [Deminuibacter soli]
MQNKVVIVTGMHRSFTSLVTQWLYKCGLHVGDNLLGANTGNDDGHFEDLDFLQAHEALLQQRGLDISGITDHSISTLTPGELATLQAMVTDKNNAHEQWGWKEPRTCLFLDAYKQIIPDAFYLVVYRGYADVVSSLINRLHKAHCAKYATRNDVSRFIWNKLRKRWYKHALCRKLVTGYLKVWIRYNEAILLHLAAQPADSYLVVNHALLYENSHAVFEQLRGKWGLHLQYVEFNAVFKPLLTGNTLDIARYVKDKTLLLHASAIENSLHSLLLHKGWMVQVIPSENSKPITRSKV